MWGWRPEGATGSGQVGRSTCSWGWKGTRPAASYREGEAGREEERDAEQQGVSGLGRLASDPEVLRRSGRVDP